MYEQWNVKDRLVPGKRNLRETVLLLAAHPAPGSLWSISGSILTCSFTEAGQLSPVQQSVSFAEIKLPAVSPDASPVFHPDLVIRKGKLVLEISNSASAELLSRIGGILDAE